MQSLRLQLKECLLYICEHNLIRVKATSCSQDKSGKVQARRLKPRAVTSKIPFLLNPSNRFEIYDLRDIANRFKDYNSTSFNLESHSNPDIEKIR